MSADNIILIGFMGSGKSAVGRKLARDMNYRFADTDQIIEETEGMKIKDIFEKHGEEHFRDLETKLLKSLLEKTRRTVLSTGGGMPVREENAGLLRSMGKVFYLKTSKETIIGRLHGDESRPLLKGNLDEKAERLLKSREPIYERAADITINTDGKTIDEIINEIKMHIRRD